MAKIRILFAFVANLILFLIVVFLNISIYYNSFSKLMDVEFRLRWSQSDPGYIWHVLSALCEWLGLFALVAYFGTFIPEFRGLYWKSLKESNVENTIDLNKIEINGNQLL